jgi:hypothetical protein
MPSGFLVDIPGCLTMSEIKIDDPAELFDGERVSEGMGLKKYFHAMLYLNPARAATHI